jgi:hypothetical protein
MTLKQTKHALFLQQASVSSISGVFQPLEVHVWINQHKTQIKIRVKHEFKITFIKSVSICKATQ